jgi:adenylate cyclase
VNKLKYKDFFKSSFFLAGILYLLVVAFWFSRGDVWTTADYQVLDLFQGQAIKSGVSSSVSPKIAAIVETDETKKYFKQSVLDRKTYATVNNFLAQLKPKAVIYDFIFRFEEGTDSNSKFKKSLDGLQKVYLPLGLNIHDENQYTPQEEKWNSRQLLPFMGTPIQKGKSAPIFAYPSLMPFQDFIKDDATVGHINVQSDSDGVFRHYPLLLKLELGYLPGLSFSAFLDNINVSIDEIIVEWGKEITIPAKAKNKLEKDLVIPINKQGQVYIPYSRFWKGKENSFKLMSLESFIEYAEDPAYIGTLREQFEDTFVFISDVSQGGKDIRRNSLGDSVPLVLLHEAFLNGLLTDSLYRNWSLAEALILLFFIVVIFAYFANSKSITNLYICGSLAIVGLVALTWFQFIDFRLFPLVSILGSVLFMFSGVVFGVFQKKYSIEK